MTGAADRPLPDGLILPRWLLLLCLPSLVAMAVILWQGAFRLAPLYYLIVIGIGWAAFGAGRWRRAAAWLQRLPGPAWLRVLWLGYAAIVAEEILVGTIAALGQGVWPDLWAARAGQFIALNLFAFFGPILGLALLVPRLAGLRRPHLWLLGLWGLWAERVWAIALTSPIGALALAGPVLAVYSVILAPAVLSVPAPPGPARLWHLPLAWAVMLGLSLPAIIALTNARQAWPGVFPPCELIPCAAAPETAP